MFGQRTDGTHIDIGGNMRGETIALSGTVIADIIQPWNYGAELRCQFTKYTN